MIKIDGVNLSGFRGINTPRRVEFGPGVTLLFGANGSGKSSILQAIEWSLTGSLPYLSGHDFVREDAIANLFHQNLSTVETAVREGEQSLTCTRARKMAKSTSRGSSEFTLELGKEVLHDEEAQSKIDSLMGFAPADFSKVAYLHQESVKELLSVDPKERSRAIDKLLGTFEARELTEALDVKRALSMKGTLLQDRIDALNRDKVQFAVNLRSRLARRKADLLKTDLRESDFTLDAARSEVVSVQKKIDEMAESCKAVRTASEAPSPVLEEIVKAAQTLETDLRSLDRQRTLLHGELRRKKQEIEAAMVGLRNAESDLQAFSGLTLEVLSEEEKRIEGELERQGPKSREVGDKMSSLLSVQTQVSNSVSFLREKSREEQATVQKYQGGVQLVELTSRLAEELRRTTSSLEGLSKLGRLASLAADYISAEKPSSCPVCEQDIAYTSVLQTLSDRAKKSGPPAMDDLRTREEDLRKRLAGAEQDQRDLERIENEMTKEKENLQHNLANASKVLGETVTEDFEFGSRIISLRDELRRQTDGVLEIRTSLDRLREQKRGLTKAAGALSKAEEELQALCGTQGHGDLLLEHAERMTVELERSITEYGETTAVDELSARLDRVGVVLDYLKDESELENVEKELPNVTDLIGRLEAAKAALAGLAGSLGAIRQAALAYEEDAVVGELESLGQTINAHYSMLLGHPVFHEISIAIERREPLIYSIRAEGNEGSTYIPTRFSTAQMNCVAIALFLANNQKLAANFGTILMDDPTQSMDRVHKAALAKLISKLSGEKQVVVATQDTEFTDLLVAECGEVKKYNFGEWSSDGPSISA